MAFVLIPSLSIGAWAQQSRNYVYGFAGPLAVPKSAFTRWDGSFIHVGGGGEASLTERFALGGEIGVLKPLTNRDAITVGLLSLNPAYHFLATSSQHKADPFVTGGVSCPFGKGGAIGLNYGGGINYWLKSRFGLRVEFRHHLWSPEAGEAIHFLDFRFGLVFRIG